MSVFRFIKKASVHLATFEKSSSQTQELYRRVASAARKEGKLELQVRVIDPVKNVTPKMVNEGMSSKIVFEFNDGSKMEIPPGKRAELVMRDISTYAVRNGVPEKK